MADQIASPDQPPPHALFIQWGKFRAGAFGIPAIVTLGALVVICTRLAAWW